jgi:CBS domain-containing membrane protein
MVGGVTVQRRSGEVRCADIMPRDVQKLGPDAGLVDACASLHEHRLMAMPMVSQQGDLLGMLGRYEASQAPAAATDGGACMRRQVPPCRPDWPVTYLLQVLTHSVVHQAPVADEERRMVALVSQSNRLAALVRMSLQGASVPMMRVVGS